MLAADYQSPQNYNLSSNFKQVERPAPESPVTIIISAFGSVLIFTLLVDNEKSRQVRLSWFNSLNRLIANETFSTAEHWKACKRKFGIFRSK